MKSLFVPPTENSRSLEKRLSQLSSMALPHASVINCVRKSTHIGRKQIYRDLNLRFMQSWSLERKIQVSQTRILEAYKIYKNMCYVSL